ncbi:AraC family transcriptional regulator [Reichenbachiella carrageenanivorans]|uniref:AraC family transcriptional regulator n=1 Tax=Reichenbachiella carrageenanivorans TaxID=2979869 RepID=A0ABY6CWP8_9BACT|nr:AraC family transcriptional regulator [Reichenbachiella carrageenanivorans]UXX77820.1 AraC family transcriptional regulator [Reichenbachiella carrageenanivorans]
MKLVLKEEDNFLNDRLNIVKKEIPCLDSSWHYHSQYELLYISKSSGIRFVGDSVSQFSAGDLVLVGPYLPHLWRNDATYYQDKTNKVNTIIFKFTKNFLGEGTFEQPEFSDINSILEQSKFGVCFDASISSVLHDELINIVDLSPVEKSIKLLNILHRLSISDKKIVLSSSDMRQYTSENSDRLDSVLKHISDHYASNITLNDVADIACMTTNSFCRFFKKMTNKSFTQFLNEVRIRNASRILVQEDQAVTEICYMVGYNSVTNFNKQFKQIMGTTPQNYRKTL